MRFASKTWKSKHYLIIEMYITAFTDKLKDLLRSLNGSMPIL